MADPSLLFDNYLGQCMYYKKSEAYICICWLCENTDIMSTELGNYWKFDIDSLGQGPGINGSQSKNVGDNYKKILTVISFGAWH